VVPAARVAARAAAARAAEGRDVLIGEILRVALGALQANKLRSFLTMLGIVIGVSAVIAMDGIGRGAQKSISDRISSLGTTLLTIIPGQAVGIGGVRSTDQQKLTLDDANAIAERATFVIAVEPEMQRQLQVQYLTKNANTAVIGTTSNYPEVRKYEIASGRMFTSAEDEGKQRVVVLGPTVMTNLGIENAEGIVGEQVRISGLQFTVVGVLAPKGQTGGFQNPDDQVLIPVQTARFRAFGTDRLRSINVLAKSEAEIPDAMADVQKVIRREHRLATGKDDDFVIRNQSDFLSTAAETTKVFTSLLAGIAAVSLLVGGIGIMNIMLVSVTERTREIGVRKALGASRGNILLQFLIEAVVLCLAGGVIGILLGLGGATALSKFANFNTQVAPSSIMLAFAFSALVGVIFGVWPARRAAGLDPIVALRYE
jgi:putative ABC transport system permease protein